MRYFLFATTSLILSCAALPAFAQETDNTAANGGVNDIIVTAQRKSESSQNAAIAIDAVTGDQLTKAGISDPLQITKLAPALTITNGGGSNTSLYLRGVGNLTSSSYNDSAIAISYDGVFLGRPAGAFGAAFYDLERVEVLKGPQGILYGRNATGGAINIIPAKPKIGERAGGFDISFGNYDAVEAQAYLNLPVGENSALRIAASRQVHDGYNLDGSSDRNVSGLRGQFLFEPSANLSVRIGADYSKLGGIGQGGTYLGNYTPGLNGYSYTPTTLDLNSGFGTAAANSYRATLLGAPGFGFLTPFNAQQSIDFTYWGVNAEVSAKTALGTLTFIPAYRSTKGTSLFSGPGFNTAYTQETDKQYTFELRLAGSRGPIDYIVGGYYFNETIKAKNEYNQEFVLPIQNYEHETKSWATFGQLTTNLTDRLRLIGGARYTHDHKSMDGIINNFITFCGGLPPANITPPASFAAGCAAPNALPHFPNFTSTGTTVAWLVANGWIAPGSIDTASPQVFPLINGRGTILKTYNPVVDSGNYSRVTWKASAEFDLGSRSLLYATIETGYRAGGFQLAEGRSSYKPEFLTAYTIGSKNRFFDNKLQLNLEGFYWKYRDQQINYFTVDTSGTLINSNENAGKVTIKGIDIDAIFKPSRNTTVSGKVQYLDAQYDDLHFYTASPRDNFNCPFTLTGQLAGGQPVKDFNCSGNQAIFSPKWTVNLGVEQIVPVGSDYELVGSVNTAWRAKQYGGFEYLDFELIAPYWTTDLNLTFRSVPGKWSISAFVRNLENTRRSLAPQLAPTGQAVTIFGAPRTYGLRVSADF
jgi:iron complex outermembrane receptor protein